MTVAAPVRRAKTTPETAPDRQPTSDVVALKDAVVAVLEDYKADNIVVLPLAGQASFADFMVVASGTSSRHVAGMGGAVGERLGRHVLGMEGQHEGEWVCVDMGAVVVHLFVPEKRALYNLEKLWSHVFDAPPDGV